MRLEFYHVSVLSSIQQQTYLLNDNDEPHKAAMAVFLLTREVVR